MYIFYATLKIRNKRTAHIRMTRTMTKLKFNQLILERLMQVDPLECGNLVDLLDGVPNIFSSPIQINGNHCYFSRAKNENLKKLPLNTHFIDFFSASFWSFQNDTALHSINDFRILEPTVWHFTACEYLPHKNTCNATNKKKNQFIFRKALSKWRANDMHLDVPYAQTSLFDENRV